MHALFFAILYIMEFLLALTALAWLIPNHYSPWSSAWNEAVAILGLICVLPFVFLRCQEWRLSKILIILPIVFWVSIASQVITGKLLFFGDGVIAAFYVAIWFASVMVGNYLFLYHPEKNGVDVLAIIWVFGSIFSVAIALIQWTNVFSLGIYGVDFPPGARPFGNVAQPNHLCTLSFMGLCGVVWLHQQRVLSKPGFWLTTIFLLIGMVLSQSRTGWLQIAWFGAFFIIFCDRIGLRLKRFEIGIVVVIFYCGALSLGKLSQWLMLSTSRSIADQMQADIRVPYWLAMVDAIGREPIWGYGWLQVGLAQQTIALDHKNFGSLFEHSHNFILDIFLWNGLILGGIILILLIVWIWRLKISALNNKVFWLAVALGGIFIHGMLEFPLEYSYFLIPAGLAMGAIDAAGGKGGNAFLMPKKLCWALFAILILVFTFLVKDYLRAEENYRQLRLESARIGVDRLVTPAAKMQVLNQLEALLVFARTEATPRMSSEELNFMKAVSERFGYPPVLFRYALAAGLNDQPEISRNTLEKICKIHEPERCKEAVEGWAVLVQQYPELEKIEFR
ncbi:O-antigen ligase family protein [Acidovorax sp. SUPP3334]|uniref:PglL family O-oligosaccharyltransferase n=1 Tax=Acidovorax sp. SUPP3334 TaxID=2920881 RepID=UPI0023DE4F48|nr:O-antigen ligase family protein [Acidovorax sp. SUPP3334]GKT25002.1 Wzy polymerase domain-containing protein [Acidovorax sp. SUPP3334]